MPQLSILLKKDQKLLDIISFKVILIDESYNTD